jgi:hypothetical protein
MGAAAGCLLIGWKKNLKQPKMLFRAPFREKRKRRCSQERRRARFT